MRASIGAETRIDAPASVVWDYVTDWPRQGEWIPFTRVEEVPDPAGHPAGARGMGGRIRAWTGLGRVGFWDPMTVTAWEVAADGRARCEVLHTGTVVRGEGEFAVLPAGPGRCTFVWSERLEVPGGAVGALVWRSVGWALRLGVAAALRRLARRVEAEHARGGQ